MPVVEFTIEGPPISAQSKNKALLQEWREKIQNEAKIACATWASAMTENVRFVCVNYHDGEVSPIDDDNMVKVIRDALQGIVYDNDKRITDSHVRQTSIDHPVRMRGASLVLAQAFCRGNEFIYIKVEPVPSHHELLT